MKVQLLTFAGCPSADPTRQRLQEVIKEVGIPVTLEEVDVHSVGCPPELRHWGSPTILVDGVDVAAGQAQDGSACRIYRQNGGEIHGVPSEDEIRTALEKARSGSVPRSSATCSLESNPVRRPLDSRIRGNLTVVIASLAAVGAGSVAVLTSACCAGPVVVAILGTSGAIAAAGLAEYRSHLLFLAFGLLGFAFWRMHSFQRTEGCCPSEASRWARWFFWACTIATVLAVMLPGLME